MKVLIVEDDKKIAGFIKSGLASEGFTVDSAGDGEEGLYLMREGKYDLVILDLMLPLLDGISVLKKARASGNKSPVIILTAKDSLDDKVKGLNAGADDYLVKPFSFVELLARIKALTRRNQPPGSSLLKTADLTLDEETREIKRAKRLISLSATEYRLLKYLMENKNKVLSKTLILENVWGYDFSPESNIVDVYIKYLRDKIDRGGKKPLIVTVHGMGYKICG